jgi:DHA1 family inner membrane transport protein
MNPMPIMPFIALGLFGLYTLEFGVVGILPAIIDRFHVTISEAGLLLGLFALTVAALGPFLVLFSSRLDRKTALIAALFTFAACSILSAFSPSFFSLLVLRIISALLHPMFYSAALSAAISLYPKEKSARAVSTAVLGTTMGLIVGVPMMSWFAFTFSYEASYLFCGSASLVAALGLLAKLPRMPIGKPVSFDHQLSILRKPALWLNIAAAILTFTALFSVYSYAAQLFKNRPGMAGQSISLMLAIFGVGGVLGNFIVGRLLDRHLEETVLSQLLVLAAAYLILYVFSRATPLPMSLIVLLWGAAHISGLVCTQMWLRSVAPEAQDFATSLYLTSANAGVLSGSSAGGLSIALAGSTGAICCGVVFATLAFIVIALKVAIYGRAPRSRFGSCAGPGGSEPYGSQGGRSGGPVHS